MSSSMEKVIERVVKLLALANDKGANENEAAVALERAYALLAQHNLSLDAVQGKASGGDEKREEQDKATNWSEKYYIQVWEYVADLNMCFFRSWRPDPRKRQTIMYVFGRQSNVVMTHVMATYLCETMRRLGRQAAKDARRSDFAFLNTYLHGMGQRLIERVWAMKTAAKEGTLKTTAADGSASTANLPALASTYDEYYRQVWLRPGRA